MLVSSYIIHYDPGHYDPDDGSDDWGVNGLENVELLTLSYRVYQITSDIICSPTMVTVAAAYRCEIQGAHISHLSASDGLNFTTYTLP